jgi:hypothetical protein
MSELKALSIRQPWLDMIVSGVKVMDIRPWDIKHLGLIALYAPWQIDFSASHLFGYETPWTLVRGKLIGAAEVERVIPLDETNFINYLDQHFQVLPVGGEVFGVVLRNIKLLDKPIPYKGQTTLFSVDHGTSKLLMEGLQRGVIQNYAARW